MTPFEAFDTYIAIKLHFTSDYNFIKYNGKTNISYDAFAKRRDTYNFQKLANLKDVRDRCIIGHLNDQYWIGDLVSSAGQKSYNEWIGYKQSFSRNFEREVILLMDNGFKSAFIVEDQHPKALKMLRQREISYETLIVLDRIFRFSKYWNRSITEELLWPLIKNKLHKYSPFFRVDIEHYKNLIQNVRSNYA